MYSRTMKTRTYPAPASNNYSADQVFLPLNGTMKGLNTLIQNNTPPKANAMGVEFFRLALGQ